MAQLGPRQMMWEFTPPPGVALQQWQTSFRLLFKDERLEEMLAWLRVQVQICEEAAEQGLFYNKQPERQTHTRPKNRDRDRERPPSVHGTRRREPRRGEDDAADPDSPPPPKRAAQRTSGGNVQADDGPMPSMSPAMAKPIPGKTKTPAPKQEEPEPADDLAAENAALRKRLAQLEGKVEPEEESPDTQPHTPTMTPPAPPAEPDLSGPKVHRHRWSAGRYEIDPENACVKCGVVCTGTEELCPVAT